MLKGIWKKLKSGSDIRGIALGDNENIELSNEVVKDISSAFIVWISKKKKIDFKDIVISIGHDSRLSSSRIKNIVINTIRAFGVTIYDCSLSSTPSMAMSVKTLQTTAAIQITASHHPKNYNGFKFFTTDGGLSSLDIEEILEIAQNVPKKILKDLGKVRTIDMMRYYIEELKNIIIRGIKTSGDRENVLKGFKIVVDAGNGVGGFFANEVLQPLGADTNGSSYLEPDGNFPIYVPNPENSDVMEHISKLTIDSNADLGIVFDTDVDRVSVVDSSGKAISKTRLVALTSNIVLNEYPNSIIVTDSMTNESLNTFIDRLGGCQLRYKRGYNNVINMAKRINNEGGSCHLAIETSGHAAFKENDFIDDGAYLACKIIVKMVNAKRENKNLSNILENLVMPIGEVDLRLPIVSDSISEATEKIFKDLMKFAKSSKSVELDEENVEGIRLHFPSKHQNGWMLLRESIHDPVLILHIESYTLGGVKSICDFMKQLLKKYNFLNLENIL